MKLAIGNAKLIPRKHGIDHNKIQTGSKHQNPQEKHESKNSQEKHKSAKHGTYNEVSNGASCQPKLTALCYRKTDLRTTRMVAWLKNGGVTFYTK